MRRWVAGGVVLALVAGLVAWAVWPERVNYTTEDRMVTVEPGLDLDTTLYLPKNRTDVPAVLLGHGFGGTKDSVAPEAKDLANLGYAVLTWTARGFGRSGGQIHLNSPDHEVRDAKSLIDWLAERPEIRRDGPGDPRVGAMGASYGGALALLLAGYDKRVDAIVPSVTWSDLNRVFFPEGTGAAPVDGVYKQAWAGRFFGAASDARRINPACGRFAAEVCETYLRIGTTGRADPAAVALLRRSSPATVLDRITAPTLLVQGEIDSLFPLSEADANARGIAANGTPVRVAWFVGGHDSGAGTASDRERIRRLTGQWLGHYLRGDGPTPKTSFTYSRVTGFVAGGQRGEQLSTAYSVAGYPGLGGTGEPARVEVAGPPQEVANPPDRNPAGISSLPIGGPLAAFVGGFRGDIPGQYARFDSAPLTAPLELAGAPTVRLRVASRTGEAVVIVKLNDAAPDNSAVVPNGLVAAVRLTGLPASVDQATPVTVTLPGIVHRFETGHRVRIAVATSDNAYATPVAPALYTIALADGDAGSVTLPTVAGEPIATPAVVWRWVLAGVVAALVLGLITALTLGRRRRRSIAGQDTDTPLVVDGLRKEYGDGYVAVSRVDFTVHRGQVVGLLGPNGAGKTTTLRVILGLIRPTDGEVSVFGHRVTPGAPALARLGALVEGPGFLPHLSGLGNLHAYWRATGRPAAEARFDEALDIAGLGDAIHRKVKAYSHGMKQRLAIAQAMLGLPELLVLDEPTDGLDPPQIAEMRRVLQRYATDGRAVLVSSHLLAEVEQTCTHVVVVHHGEIVASGPVGEIVGDSPTVQFEVSNMDEAATVLREFGAVSTEGRTLTVDLDGTPRAEAVAALVNAGVGVDRVIPRRRLEDAFLALVKESS